MSFPFHRTPQGLSNQATFTKVDTIVFAEGGSRRFTLAELEAGEGNSSTLDAAFWSTIIRACKPGRKIEVRSVGNKQTVKAIAQLLIKGVIRNVAVALDRDFDDRRGCKLIHQKILYTYGYSWENDVFSERVISDLLCDLIATEPLITKARESTRVAAQDLEESFSVVVRLDHALASSGRHITSREEIINSIKLNDHLPPQIERSTLAAELNRLRAAKLTCRLGTRLCATAATDLHGHTVSKWWLGHTKHLLRTLGNIGIASESIARIAIATYSRHSHYDSRQHYSTMIASADI